MKKITTEYRNRLSCLVVGQAGIGKTSLLRTLCGQEFNGEWKQVAEPQKVCVLSAEGGLLCVKDLIEAGLIDGYEIESLEDFIEAQRFVSGAEFRKSGAQWIFVDSLTEIASRCAESMERKYPSKTDSFKMWGEYNKVLTDIIKSFRDMTDFSVVFTCLEAMTADAATGARTLQPDISGSQLKNRLTSYFDEVFHMKEVVRNGKSVRALCTTGGIGKDRSGRLEAQERPSLLHVQNKIFGNSAEKENPNV